MTAPSVSATEEAAKKPAMSKAWQRAFVLSLAGLTYGARISHFLPSHAWAITGLWPTLAIAVGIFAIAAASKTFVTRNPPTALRNKWTRAGMLAAFLSIGVYMSLVVGGGELINYAVGTVANRDAVVASYSTATTRWTCPGPRIEDGFPNGALCGLPYKGDELPYGTLLRIHGKSSWFGIQVETTSAVQPRLSPDECCISPSLTNGFDLH